MSHEARDHPRIAVVVGLVLVAEVGEDVEVTGGAGEGGAAAEETQMVVPVIVKESR